MSAPKVDTKAIRARAQQDLYDFGPTHSRTLWHDTIDLCDRVEEFEAVLNKLVNGDTSWDAINDARCVLEGK